MVGFRGLMLNRKEPIRFGRSSDEAASELICADNLAVLEELDDACLSAIYVDPPFGTGGTRRGRSASYRDPMSDPVEFVSWLEPRLAHFRRTLQETGSLFVHLDHRTVHYVKVALDGIFGRSRFINEVIWCYSVGGKSPRRFGRKHDSILWYGRSASYAFYPDQVMVPRKPSSHMRVVRNESGELVQEKTDRKTGKVYRYPVARGKVPEDWWADIETLNRGDRERTGWPTQKPERLLRRLLAAVARPGDRAADFFCGSGTTGVVAQALDLQFLGVDAEPAAIETAASRMAQAGQAMAASGYPPRDLVVGGVAEVGSAPLIFSPG